MIYEIAALIFICYIGVAIYLAYLFASIRGDITWFKLRKNFELSLFWFPLLVWIIADASLNTHRFRKLPKKKIDK